LTVQIALLKGINVGGNKKIAMSDLRDVCAALGLEDVRTLLQSGNVVFRSSGRRPAALETLLESAAETRLGVRTDFFVRTDAQWSAIVEGNPFREEARREPGYLLVMCLRSAPKPGAEKSLRAAISGRETVRVAGREAYLVYPDGVGRSRLTNAVLERHLGTSGTARNWNTVLKIAALTGG
jgi:uncharacterized protein (DUF1697 family)